MNAYYNGSKITEIVNYYEGEAQGWAVVRLEDCDFDIAVNEMFIVIE